MIEKDIPKECKILSDAIKIMKIERDSWSENPRLTIASIYKKAFDMAIRSLEAWEKVKREVKYREADDGWNPIYEKGFLAGIATALSIIDKHLAEVEKV